ncbi:MAG: hypothetical protein WBC44_14715 [Planctomycetaceae bacterium]
MENALMPTAPRFALAALLALSLPAATLAGKPGGGGPTQPPPPPPVIYELTWLGAFGGASSAALDNNDLGQVVGTAALNDGSLRAFIYAPGVGMQDLNNVTGADELGWVLTKAAGINNAGQITGTGLRDGQTRAYRYSPPAIDPESGSVIPATIDDLGILDPTHTASRGRSINAWGDVAGVSEDANRKMHPFLAVAGENAVGFAPAGYTAMDPTGLAVNDFGQVVGQFNDGTMKFWSFRYSPMADQTWEEFGPLVKPRKGYGSSRARDINEYGEFCGSATVADGSRRAYLYTDGAGMKDLGAGAGSDAWVLNNPDPANGLGSTIVGQLPQSTKDGVIRNRAFIYRDDWGVVALDSAVTGTSGDLATWHAATIIEPRSINDDGQICGQVGRDQQAFVLTPLEL